MQDPRPVIALIIILFLIFAPDTPTQLQQHIARLDDVLNHELQALEIQNATFYGDFSPSEDNWLNLTGWHQEDGFGWSYLEDFRSHSTNLTQHALGSHYDEKALGQPTGTSLPLYSNITGVVHGEWLREEWPEDCPAPAVNRTLYLPRGPARLSPNTPFGRNLTGDGGRMTVRFSEDEDSFAIERRKTIDGVYTDVATFVTAHIGIESHGGGDNWELRAHGIHFLETGHIILTTTSDKFDGLYGLPHMTWSPYLFRIAQSLVSRAVDITIGRQKAGTLRSFSPFTSSPDGMSESPFRMPQCELVVAMQQQPISMSPALNRQQQSELLDRIESQLRFPTGIGFPTPQPMEFSLTAFSPDCGYIISSAGPPAVSPAIANHLSGVKLEVEEHYARHHILFFMLVLAGQLYFHTKQMKEASTPSVRSRISFYTIAMMAMGDGFSTISLAMISLFVPGLWVLLMSTFFLAFLSVSFFGMRFLMEIWMVQAPERERRDRERQAAATPAPTAPQRTTPATAVPAANSPATPATAPATAAPVPAPPRRMIDAGSMPIVMPTEQPRTTVPQTLPVMNPIRTNPIMQTNPRASFGAVYTRICFLLMSLLFLTLNASSWPSPLRRIYFTTLSAIYLSFWVPQIYRNAFRNCRRALRWDFVIGQSVLRLAPFAYFYAYSWNVLFAEVDFVDLCILASWVWVQLLALGSQEILGPRWFLKRDSWMPPAYDYHPVLKGDEEGSNLPVGGAEGREDGVKVWDCAVCMQTVEVHVQTGAGEGGLAGPGGLLARRAYMMTPCRHIFHAKCLEGWMKYRLQCPICREDLPPM